MNGHKHNREYKIQRNGLNFLIDYFRPNIAPTRCTYIIDENTRVIDRFSPVPAVQPP